MARRTKRSRSKRPSGFLENKLNMLLTTVPSKTNTKFFRRVPASVLSGLKKLGSRRFGKKKGFFRRASDFFTSMPKRFSRKFKTHGKRRFGYGPGYAPLPGDSINAAAAPYYGSMEPFSPGPVNWFLPITNNQYQIMPLYDFPKN